jgi:DNA-binding protein HU-beta
MQLHKTDLIRKLAKKHRRSQQHYTDAVREIFEGIREELSNGHSVNILEFGTFLTRPIAERQTRSIRTQQTITIPAHQRVGFRPGERLRRTANKAAPKTNRKKKSRKYPYSST